MKNILFLNTTKLAVLSAMLLLAVFCTIGMSFTPAEEGENVGNPNDSTYVTGPRRAHSTDGCTGKETNTKDYAKTIAVSLGNGTVYVSTSQIERTGQTGTTGTPGEANSTSYITWNCGADKTNDTQVKYCWAIPKTGYHFLKWTKNSDGSGSTSTKNPYSFSVTAASENESSPTEGKIYAVFEANPTYTATFKVATNGSYTYQYGTNAAVTVTTEQSVTTNMNFVLTATPASGYKVFGWYTLSGTTKTYFEYLSTSVPSYALEGNTTIGVDFVPSSLALFTIKGTSSVYADLNEAATAAASSSSKIVVPTSNGTVPAGNYTIPANVTLLVPYDDAYTVNTASPTTVKADALPSPKDPSLYRKLTLEDGVNIVVQGGGSICVNAKILSGNTTAKNVCGRVTGGYGLIDMMSGSSITLSSGANLYCWGYIIGEGTIEAQSEAHVYEPFQLADFRGGNASTQFLIASSCHKVFPYSQYYVQNIEVPITLYAGAKETLFSGFITGKLISNGSDETIFAPKFVGSDGLFDITEGTFTKYYDKDEDRLVCTVNGNLEMKKIKINIKNPITGTTHTISSEDYVLPITNNLTININSGTTKVSAEAAWLAGARTYIAEGATLQLTKPTYIYDRENWVSGQYVFGGSGNQSYFRPLHYSGSGGTSIKTKRTDENLLDAVIDVNGTLIANDFLYTTAGTGTEPNLGGADICSSEGTGVIQLTKGKGTQTKTYQATQPKDIEYDEIPITSAQLHNGEEWYKEGNFKKEYLATAEVSAPTTIQYANNHWGWMEIWKNGNDTLEISNTCTKVDNPDAFSGSLSKEGHTLSWTTTVNNDNQEVIHTATWTPIKYTITWKNGETVLEEEQVEYGTTPTYSGETPTKAADAQYTYTFAGWDPEVVAVTGDATYTATFTQTAQTYTVVFDANGGAGAMESQSFTYGEEAKALTANTFTRTGYTFAEWNTVADGTGTSYENEQSVQNLTENITLYAQWTFAQVGDPLDIVDADGTNLTINANGWASSRWPYTVSVVTTTTNTNSYEKTARQSDRTLKVPYSGDLNADMQIIVTNTSGTVSNHIYKVPFVYTGSEDLSAMDASSIVFVHSGTLTISGTDVKAAAIYVSPGAELNVTGTLTVGKLVLRTTPWQAAVLTNSGTITGHVYYSRIARDADFHLFAIPAGSNTAGVVLSDGTSAAVASTVAPYGNAWQLREYNTARRAEAGDDGANWDNIGVNGDGKTYLDVAIEASKGYELRSGSKYYREYLFPITLPTTATEVVVVSATGAAGAAHAGWNILCSPYTGIYTVKNYNDPATAIKVCWQQTDGSYIQEQPKQIKPAVPFAYQASQTGALAFDTNFTFAAPAPRKQSAAEALTETEWVHLDIFDAYGEGDETSLFVHPTRFEQTYKTGIDMAKQSLTASRPIIYSTHAYGDMAFAGVADSLLENGIDLVVYSPSAQELTFSLRENKFLNRLEYLWLADNETGARTDLLMNDYTFRADAGTAKGRFVLNGRFKAPQISTGIGNTQTDYNIYAIGNNIAISGVERGTPIYVFDAVGHMIYTTAATSDEVIVPAPCAGVYMLSVGGQTAKLVINK